MGDPKRRRKIFTRPKQLFSPVRIEEEKNLVNKYGLKNRREIWRTETMIKKIRDQAKKLILHPEKQQEFIARLNKLGLVTQNATIDDVLDLTKEKLLERRFQTIVFNKKLAKTIRAARQLITHKKIRVDKQICNIPGRLIDIEEENKITLAK